MKLISAKELKNKTGDILRRVTKGEKVLVTKRGRPCAIISPIEDKEVSTLKFRSYEDAWEDIEKTLRKTKARDKTWEEAIRWSRRRA